MNKKMEGKIYGKKLFHLLKQINKKELQNFGDYLKVTHKRKIKLLSFFDYIKDFHPRYSATKVGLVAIQEQLFPELSEKRIKNIPGELYYLLEEYLIRQRRIKQSKIKEEEAKVQVYLDKDLGANYLKEIRKEKITPSSIKLSDPFELFQKFEFYHTLFFNPNSKALQKAKDPVFDNLVQHFELFQVLMKFELILEAEIIKITSREVPVLNIEKEEYEHFMEYREIATFDLLLTAIRSLPLKNPDLDYKYLLLYKSQIELNLDHMSKHYKGIFIHHFQNLISQVLKDPRQSAQKTAPILMEVFKLREEHDLLLYDGIISYILFINIIATAAGCEEFDWADKFISKYSRFLNKNYRNEAILISKARIAIAKDAPTEALEMLSKIKTEITNIELRTNCLKIYCMLNLAKSYEEYEKVRAACKNFSRRLKNSFVNKIPANHFKGIRNFLNFISRLIDAEKTKKELEKELQSFFPVFYKFLLELKLDKYKAKYN